MTIDHTTLIVPADKFAAALKWYEAALAPLGYKKLMEFDNGTVVGFGDLPHKADWWIVSKPSTGGHNTHHAFTAKDRAAVDGFYKAAVDAGGEDNGKPGVRTMYHENYYGTFVKDPAGNNIEAVCHKPA